MAIYAPWWTHIHLSCPASPRLFSWNLASLTFWWETLQSYGSNTLRDILAMIYPIPATWPWIKDICDRNPSCSKLEQYGADLKRAREKLVLASGFAGIPPLGLVAVAEILGILRIFIESKLNPIRTLCQRSQCGIMLLFWRWPASGCAGPCRHSRGHHCM